jgi:hypothetical protein
MHVIAFIQSEIVARLILRHLGLSARPPPRGKPHRRGQLPFDVPAVDEGVDFIG